MIKRFLRGCAVVLSLLAMPTLAVAGQDTLESKIITGFEPFEPPTRPLIMTDGSEATLASFKGELVLATVWFTTCPFCGKEMPMLDKLAADLKARGIDNIRLLPVSIDNFVYRETPEAAQTRIAKFYDRKKLSNLDSAVDVNAVNSGLLFNPDQVGTPTTFFIAPSGKIIAVLAEPTVDWNLPGTVEFLQSLAAS